MSKGEDWEKQMRTLLKESLDPIEKSLQELRESRPSSSPEASEMPLYKCKDGNCAFSTDDLDAYLDHRDAHKAQKPAEEEKPEPKKRHETVGDFLNCRECRPRFDEHYLREGWKPPKKEAEKEKEKPEREGGLNL